MAPEQPPLPPNAIWTSGFIVGMALPQAQSLYESARADIEPTVGKFAANVAGGLAFVAWLGLVYLLVGWCFRRPVVRAMFQANEKGPTNPA